MFIKTCSLNTKRKDCFLMLFKRINVNDSEEEKNSFCFSMEQIFEQTVNERTSFVVDGSQDELIQKTTKIILFYSDLITLITRNRSGGDLVITLIVHANNIIRKLMLAHSTDAQHKEVFLKIEINNALSSLNAFLQIMGEIENNGWMWFKDEKMIIKDFLHKFNKPLKKGLDSK